MEGDEVKKATARIEKDGAGSTGGVKLAGSEKPDSDNGNGPAESKRWLFAGRQKWRNNTN
jgi:hypothetical protein